MNGISVSQNVTELDPRVRFAPKLKPEVRRLEGNPFYPNGFAGSTSSEPAVETEKVEANTYTDAVAAARSESQRQVFEANLPVTQQERTQKVGTMLNTVA